MFLTTLFPNFRVLVVTAAQAQGRGVSGQWAKSTRPLAAKSFKCCQAACSTALPQVSTPSRPTAKSFTSAWKFYPTFWQLSSCTVARRDTFSTRTNGDAFGRKRSTAPDLRSTHSAWQRPTSWSLWSASSTNSSALPSPTTDFTDKCHTSEVYRLETSWKVIRREQKFQTMQTWSEWPYGLHSMFFLKLPHSTTRLLSSIITARMILQSKNQLPSHGISCTKWAWNFSRLQQYVMMRIKW